MNATVPAKINDRWDIALTPDRAEFHAARPRWEAERLAAMAEVVGPGCMVVDVGAECGDFTALYGMWAQGFTVCAMEPQPLYWPAIRAHWRANLGVHAPMTWQGFAADRTNVLDPIVLRGWPKSAYSEITPDAGFLHLAQSEDDVVALALDDLALERLDVVTIDTEGSEYRVLRGAQRALAEARPHVFVAEHTDAAWMAEHYPDEGHDAIDALMRSYDYDGALLASTHEDHWHWWPR